MNIQAILDKVARGEMDPDQAWNSLRAPESPDAAPVPADAAPVAAGGTPVAALRYLRREWGGAMPASAGTGSMPGPMILIDLEPSRPWVEGPWLATRLPGAFYHWIPAEGDEGPELEAWISRQGGGPLHFLLAWNPGSPSGAEGADAAMGKALALFDALRRANQLRGSRPGVLHLAYPQGSADSPLGEAAAALARSAAREDSRLTVRLLAIAEADCPASMLHGMLGDWLAHPEWPDDMRWTRPGFSAAGVVVSEALPTVRAAEPVLGPGTYLFTGGAGGLARALIPILPWQGRPLVILAGRQTEERWRAAGEVDFAEWPCRIEYRQADMGKDEDVFRLIDGIRRERGPLRGIFHGAGMNRDGLLRGKSPAEIRGILAPKLAGTLLLDHHTREEPLDFMVLFSSLSAFFGNAGQTDYAFANAFMDGFARRREGMRRGGLRQGRTLSLAWPVWEAGGISLPPVEAELLRNRTGLHLLPARLGALSLLEAMGSEEAHAAVAYAEPDALRAFLALPEPGVPAAADPRDGKASGPGSGILPILSGFMAQATGLQPAQIDPRAEFETYGIDSIMISRLNLELEKAFGPLPKTLFFENRTLADLADAVASKTGRRPDRVVPAAPSPEASETRAEAPAAASPHPEVAGPGSRSRPAAQGRDVAIIGLAGRYPKSGSVDAFWRRLAEGADCVAEVPPERWDWRSYFDPDPEAAHRGRIYCKWGGFLDGFDAFDARFFNISPREAALMDPQERIFLETVWETLEDAGYPPERLKRLIRSQGLPEVGVYAGVTTFTYPHAAAIAREQGAVAVPNSSAWSLANRVSHLFDFRGPSLPVDTACSASLVALHLACQAIRRGECSYAVAGGVNLYLHPVKYQALCQVRMLSAKGRCASFGAGGDGFVPGEGVGAVLLKRLDWAERDGDNIHGVIKGSAINHGGRTHGYTVPNPHGQAEVVAMALRDAGIPASTVSYVEAHGTGTALGDPIEVSGLQEAFSLAGGAPDACFLGSVKSNIGHLESAAGMAGLTKVLLQMRHGKIVPTLNCEAPNPDLDLSATPFRLPRGLEDWTRPADGAGGTLPRRAGISMTSRSFSCNRRVR